jgi:hypothetical protein
MTYAIFKYRNRAQINELISALSLLTLQAESKISWITVKSITHQYKKISNLPNDELIGISACGELNLDGITLVKFIKNFKSDKNLLTAGNDYLGCVLKAPKKKELLERITVLKKVIDNKKFPSLFFSPRGLAFNDHLREIGLSDIEIKELDKISSTLAKPLEKWASKREKVLMSELDVFPKLVTKNF